MRNEEKQAQKAESVYGMDKVELLLDRVGRISRQNVIDTFRRYEQNGLPFDRAIELIQEIQDKTEEIQNV